MREVIAQLESLRRRGWLMLVAQRCALLLSAVIGAAIVLVLLDYAMRLPGGVRAVFLVGFGTACAFGVWRFVLPAIRFKPSVTQLALRLERFMPALAGRLASSIEFAAAGIDQSNALAARSVRETQSRLAGESMSRLIQPRQTLRDLALLFFALLLASFFIFGNPSAAQTGLSRLLLPFSDARWPARTGVESLMAQVLGDQGVHPRGQALLLRASVTRGDLDQRIDARFRVRTADAFGPWQHVVLTQQGASAVHERLIEPAGDEVEVYFASADDQTQPERIHIVMPPAVRRASLTVTPPEYAAGLVPLLQTELGPGTDSRAQTDSASLIGSRVRLDLLLNKPLPAPGDKTHVRADEDDLDEWLRSTFGWTDEADLPTFIADPGQPERWTLEWTLDQTRTLPIHLVDEHGLANSDSIAYRIDAIADAPPSVAITQPQADEAVLPTAVVSLATEAHDDVGIAHLALEARRERGGAEATEPIWSHLAMLPGVPSASQSSTTELDLAPLALSSGDVLYVTAVAGDVYQAEGETRPPTISAPRRLRIISEIEMEEMLRRQLAGVRQNAIRMESQQAELQESIAEDGADQVAQRAQAQLSERIAAQREAIAQMEQQLRSNRLESPQVESLLRQSADLLEHAGRASNEAAAAMQVEARLGRTEPRDRQIMDHQDDVRAELSDLIELLDRDEDTWVVKRRLEGLMQDQAALQEEAAAMSERTIGRSLEELSQQELSDLDRIAQRQRDVRNRSRDLTDELRQRADQLESVDPRAAQGMRDAARTAEQRELDRDLNEAAERLEQNRMARAQQSQQNAAATLQRMLQDVEQTQQARAEELLRQLASLVQSIERLMTAQENELIALANARHREDFTGRDQMMIRLHQNTQAVAAEARALGSQPAQRRIARALDRAADAQSTAISALRAKPIQVDDAEDAENRSLELLREAKELAEELEQQTQDEEATRKRDGLIQAYRDFAQREVALREQTLGLQAAEELDRRQLVEARRLGTQQDEIRTGLLDLQRSTQEVMDSMIFSLVHRRIDDWARHVVDALDAAEVGAVTTDRQQSIAEAIGHLVQALEEQQQQQPEFDEGEQQGGGASGGGAQPVIPPVAELRLLRGMQQQVYNQTRSLDQRTDLDDAQLQQRLRDLGSQQRELIEIGRRMLEALEQQQGPPQ